MLTGLSTAKNGKSRLELYDPNGEEKLISGLSKKNGATVTVYPIWTKVTPAQPSADASLSVSEGGVSLHMTSSVGVTPENGSLVFEYSTSPLFLFGVKTVRIDSETIDPENVGAVKEMTVDEGLKNKTYYVRIKYGVKDSAGKYSYSKYSKTATAARLK